MELVKIRSTPLQSKIREIYKSSQANGETMMGPNGQPIPYGMYANNLTQLMGLSGAYGIQQQSLQGRNPYATGAGYPTSAAAAHPSSLGGHPGMFNPYQQVAPSRTMPLHPNVKLQRLPFYDIHAELLKPATLIAQGGNRFQEAQFQFVLSPSQATNIASNRDIQIGTRLDYLYQVRKKSYFLNRSMFDNSNFFRFSYDFSH